MHAFRDIDFAKFRDFVDEEVVEVIGSEAVFGLHMTTTHQLVGGLPYLSRFISLNFNVMTLINRSFKRSSVQ